MRRSRSMTRSPVVALNARRLLFTLENTRLPAVETLPPANGPAPPPCRTPLLLCEQWGPRRRARYPLGHPQVRSAEVEQEAPEQLPLRALRAWRVLPRWRCVGRRHVARQLRSCCCGRACGATTSTAGTATGATTTASAALPARIRLTSGRGPDVGGPWGVVRIGAITGPMNRRYRGNTRASSGDCSSMAARRDHPRDPGYHLHGGQTILRAFINDGLALGVEAGRPRDLVMGSA